MKNEYLAFIRAHPKLTEPHEIKKEVSPAKARQILTEQGTPEQKAMIDKIKDGGKPITMTLKTRRPVNTKNRIKQMIKEKRSEKYITNWMDSILKQQEVKIKV